MSHQPILHAIVTDRYKGRENKYVARADSTPFKDAPKVVVNAISRLDWAAKVALNGQHFDGHNEILVVGYMQEQGMGVSTRPSPEIGQSLLKSTSIMMMEKPVLDLWSRLCLLVETPRCSGV